MMFFTEKVPSLDNIPSGMSYSAVGGVLMLQNQQSILNKVF